MEEKTMREEWKDSQAPLDVRQQVLNAVAEFKEEEAVCILASAINECLLPRGFVGNVTYRRLASFATQG